MHIRVTARPLVLVRMRGRAYPLPVGSGVLGVSVAFPSASPGNPESGPLLGTEGRKAWHPEKG